METGNGSVVPRSRRVPPLFKNQVEEGHDSPNRAGAAETVGQLLRNQNPAPSQPPPNQSNPEATPTMRLARADRIHPPHRHAAPMFQAEYNYSTANPPQPPYRHNDESLSDPGSVTSPPPRRIHHHKRTELQPTPSVEPKPKFGFSTAAIIFVIQAVIIFLFGLFVSYGDEARANVNKNRTDGEYHPDRTEHLHRFYPFYQDVHVMIFVGFGFLMTFLRKYGYSAVGYNMLIAAIAIQWSILCRGVFHHDENTIPINIQTLINGDFAAAAVLITFGALLGVTNPLHLVALCLIEVFLYALNEYIGTELYKAVDIGGTIFIHTFGAYFGLALSLVLRRQPDIDTKYEGSSYNSDLFAMIGTVFLWLFWPSFNGAMAAADDQHRAVLNTVLSLSASCIFSFAASSLICAENKFSMVHVQNATLAGGVAVGAVADLMIQPFGALVIGAFAGLLSTAGYVYLTPFLQRTIGLHDTCGVHNLHGMPGVFGGLMSVLMAGIATEDMYGIGLYLQYPARSPEDVSSLVNDLSSIVPGNGRSAQAQAWLQLAALGTTMGIALVGGAVTGLLLRIPCCGKVPTEALFDDSLLWELPEPDGSCGDTEPNGMNTVQLDTVHQKL